jgi:hypothetical protein
VHVLQGRLQSKGLFGRVWHRARGHTSVCRSAVLGPCGVHTRIASPTGPSSRRSPPPGSWTARWGAGRRPHPAAYHKSHFISLVDCHRLYVHVRISQQHRVQTMSKFALCRGHMLGSVLNVRAPESIGARRNTHARAGSQLRTQKGATRHRTATDFRMISAANRATPSISTDHTTHIITCSDVA